MIRTRKLLALISAFLLLFSVFVPAAFAATIPDAPELTVTQLAGRFSLSWSTPYNGGSPITGFKYAYYLSADEALGYTWQTVESTRTEDTTPMVDCYGQEYTFRLVAVNAEGESAETVVHSTLLHQNHINVSRVRDRIEQTSFSATLQEASTTTALKAFLEGRIAEIDSAVNATVNITSFEPAQLTQVGSFQFTVSLSLGNPGEPTYASTVTKALKGVISSSGKLSTPKISISTSDEGGLAYQITTTGTAAQAEKIQSFKVSVYDTLNDQAVVTDYNINAAEKSGVINLSAGLKGETMYRAAVKACSNNSLEYLDSELSDLSVAARSGRIPITVVPNITEMHYGDTEPVFSYEVVKGPNPLPAGVDLKLTFTRAPGTDVGTYAFAFQQTDTNYLVTLEDTVFEILPRPLTIYPADREVIFEDGTTFLLQELGEVEGLVEGDTITVLEFDPADARGEVGEFEISASRAVIMSGDRDVTKNYDITYAAGKLIVHPVGYTPDAERGFPLWIILVIIAALLLIAAAIVLFVVLRKKSPEESEDDVALDDAAVLGSAAIAAGAVSEDGAENSYEEYLEIIDLGSVEQKAEEELAAEAAEQVDAPDPLAEDLAPAPDASVVQATIDEIENAQAEVEEAHDDE